MAETKTCPACEHEQPLDRYHFKPLSSGRGFERTCRECLRARSRQRYRERQAARPPKPPKTDRRCNQCGETKPLAVEYFNIARRSERGAVIAFDYWCKTCRAAYRKAAYAANPEPSRARSREAYYRMKADPERWAREQRRSLERQREWQARNREKIRERERRYREKLRRDPVRYKARLEALRIDNAIRAGHRNPEDRRYARRGRPLEDRMPMLPAAPLVAFIAERIALEQGPEALFGDVAEGAVCARLGIDPRQYRAWRLGEIERVHYDVADRVATRADRPMWEIWPELAEDGAVAA